MTQKLYDMMDWAAIEEIVYSEAANPEKLLGPHSYGRGSLVFAFFPGASAVILKSFNKKYDKAMEQADEAGVFAIYLPVKNVPEYYYEVEYEDRRVTEKDPYLYTCLCDPSYIKKFNSTAFASCYKFLGAHPARVTGYGANADLELLDTDEQQKNDIKNTSRRSSSGTLAKSKSGRTASEDGPVKTGIYFSVWAPGAMRVSLVGDFNNWDGRTDQMMEVHGSGIFELFMPDLKPGTEYKFEVKSSPVNTFLKKDPFAFGTGASGIESYPYTDSLWMKKRNITEKSRISIYEVHLGTWMQKTGKALNYRELAKLLAPYAEEMGFTHVELLPIMEFSNDDSLGYETVSYYAPASRYGSPKDLMFFIDYMHKNGIGVILDWVPAYFPKDPEGLIRFSGKACFEYDGMKGENTVWNTRIFDYGKAEVRNFLLSSAAYWASVYHADGLNISALSSMIHLDFGKNYGEWQPNIYGGNENLEAIDFLKSLNTYMHEHYKGFLMIGEDESDYPDLTSKEENGLGFDFKWNVTWKNDFLNYMKTDPLFRKGRHTGLTMSLLYAYKENFILPFGHDDCSAGRGSILMKMPGDMTVKYGNLRAAYGFLFTHPGKKLMFMGDEFADPDEWNGKDPLDPVDLNEEERKFKTYIKDLNGLLEKNPAIYELDSVSEGFEWISCLDSDHSVISFIRYSEDQRESLQIVINFTPVLYENFRIGVKEPGKYKEIFNSDAKKYGGTDHLNGIVSSSEIGWDGRENSVSLVLPPLGVCILKKIQ
jgi:1,4-alpha-glucan branching enzyme